MEQPFAPTMVDFLSFVAFSLVSESDEKPLMRSVARRDAWLLTARLGSKDSEQSLLKLLSFCV